MIPEPYGIHELVAPLVYKAQQELFRLNEMLRYQAMTFPSTDRRSIELGVYVDQVAGFIFDLDALVSSSVINPVVAQES